MMFFKSRKLSFIILGTSLLICTSVFAAPALKQIKAYLNPSIHYTLNGETILTDTEDIPANHLILNITSETTIQSAYSTLTYTLDDLQQGMPLSIEHSPAMTRSLPPQTVAYALTILEETTTPILEEETTIRMLSNMYIINVNPDENYFIVVPEGKDSTDFYDQILIRYSKDTIMNTKSGQELAPSFKEGQIVTIKVGPAATLSIPPQMLALEITLEA